MSTDVLLTGFQHSHFGTSMPPGGVHSIGYNASGALKHIAAFYAIEKEIRGRSAEERRLVRQQKSRPPADALRYGCALSWLSSARRSSSPRPSAMPSLARLTRFIDDGRIELDNNTAERSIRGIKLSRKNALFAGSDGGVDIGPSSQPWSRLASSTTSIRSPISPTS
ncbi:MULTISPECIES: IS66 family transposase [unclassified Bradyrhizobium]|uniref:IS66 family transposase n=1 Tax=unclassified Bradyrhizobium TaxID=2631580 RepID=UPI001FF73905|nr:MULTISPECIES: IS66 family transposase [unclassified Bradyrhizobium]